MNVRNVGFLLLGLVIGVVATLTLRPEPSQAQEKGDEKATPGRYQMTSSYNSARGLAELVVVDTATGECWTQGFGDKNWRDRGSPVKAKK
jgi:hypothetical protein